MTELKFLYSFIHSGIPNVCEASLRDPKMKVTGLEVTENYGNKLYKGC